MIPETLREYKEINGLTIQKLAEKLNLSYAYIAYLITGRSKPSRKLAERISQQTGIPILGLLYPEKFEKKEWSEDAKKKNDRS
ncbi:MAG: helix-turn-helix transcriptional regulator [Bacilli bacterium]